MSGYDRHPHYAGPPVTRAGLVAIVVAMLAAAAIVIVVIGSIAG